MRKTEKYAIKDVKKAILKKLNTELTTSKTFMKEIKLQCRRTADR
jgi:hypothetical protein